MIKWPFKIGARVKSRFNDHCEYTVINMIWNGVYFEMLVRTDDGVEFYNSPDHMFYLADKNTIPKPNCGRFALSEWS